MNDRWKVEYIEGALSPSNNFIVAGKAIAPERAEAMDGAVLNGVCDTRSIVREQLKN